MRLFKPTYLDREGQRRKTIKWYLDFFTSDGIRHRLPLFADRRACESVKNTIAECLSCKVAKIAFEPELQRKLDVLPRRILTKLCAWGLLDNARVEGAKPLIEHLVDFEKYLLTKGDTKTHVDLVVSRARRVIEGCELQNWSDVSANKVQGYLAGLRDEPYCISAQTFNFYLQATKQFCRWMVQERRASENPLQHLKGLNVRTDRRHDRRALEPDEIRHLLASTQAAGTRFGMDGYERALLYRLAIETGLRADELRSLKVSSFDFGKLTVTVEAAYSKHRRQDILPLRKDTAAELQQFLAGKLPNVKAFGGTYKRLTDKTHLLIRADLQAAGIAYVDESGRYADFHSLRHTTGSLLAASGAHPKVAQAIMRHSTIDLTMSRYTHIFRGQESEAVEALPNLSLPSREQSAVKTGTDGENVFDNCLDSSLHKRGVLDRTSLDYPGQNNGVGDRKTPFSEANGRIRTDNRRFTKPETENHKSYSDKSLTKTENPVFDTSLDNLLQKYPDLVAVVKAWPKLPDSIKQAIKTLIEKA